VNLIFSGATANSLSLFFKALLDGLKNLVNAIPYVLTEILVVHQKHLLIKLRKNLRRALLANLDGAAGGYGGDILGLLLGKTRLPTVKDKLTVLAAHLAVVRNNAELVRQHR
jgi:hypothetical protein